MTPVTHRSWPLGRFARRGLAWLVILSLILRGLIPVGYMPDTSQGRGVFALMACDGMNHSGHHHAHEHHDKSHKHQGVCPYAAAAISGFAEIHSPVVEALAFQQADLPVAPDRPLRQERFGNASPRSPPFFS